MPKNNNTEVTNTLRNGLKINQAVEEVPTEVGKTIVPVYISNPIINLTTQSSNTSDTANAVIHTCHATKRTFLVGGYVSVAKDVNNDGKYTLITIDPKYSVAGRFLLSMKYEPLTAGSDHMTIMLPHAIELAKGSNVTFYNGSATASIDVNATIYYYELDE